MAMKKVLVFGHSFVRRLSEWMDSQQIYMDLDCEFHIHGVGGRTVPKLISEDFHVVREIQPDIVFLQIGENDINAKCTWQGLAEAMENLVQLLKDTGVQTVIVGSLYSRPKPRDMPNWEFSNIANMVTRRLQTVAQTTGAFVLWRHGEVPLNRFARDGVHLNNNGHRDFFTSIQTALKRSLHGSI